MPQILKPNCAFPFQHLANPAVDDQPRRIVENENVGRLAGAGFEPRPFANQRFRKLVGALAANHLVERIERRGIIAAPRARDGGLHRLRFLAHRDHQARGRKPELLHEPGGFSLLDRPGLLVVAEQDDAGARVAADLQHA